MSHRPVQEEDRIATGRVVGIGVAALLAFLLGVAWAVRVQRAVMGRLTDDPLVPPSEAGRAEVGMVLQVPFQAAGPGQPEPRPLAGSERRELPGGLAARGRARLGGYGWVDRRAGVAFIPIEEAMRLVAEGGER